MDPLTNVIFNLPESVAKPRSEMEARLVEANIPVRLCLTESHRQIAYEYLRTVDVVGIDVELTDSKDYSAGMHGPDFRV
jgi:hypothetical protein